MDNLNIYRTLDVSEDELYLQFALEQSMREAAALPTGGSNSYFETSVNNVSDWHGDADLAYAIGESIRTLRLEQLMREGSTTVNDTGTTEHQTFMVLLIFLVIVNAFLYNFFFLEP